MTPLTAECVAAALPEPVREMKVGQVLYSGRTAWVRNDRPDIYLLGLNPGGRAGTDEATLAENLAWTLAQSRHSNYMDESWNARPEVGTHPMQRRITALFAILGIDLRSTPASNVAFARSNVWATLPDPDAWMRTCWTFHRTMIDALEPRIIVCMGNPAAAFVSAQAPGPPVVKVRHTSRSKVTWAEDQAPIVQAALATVP